MPAYKKEWTDYIKTGAALEQAKFSDLHIRVSPQGDTAIASYLLHVTTRAADKSVDGRGLSGDRCLVQDTGGLEDHARALFPGAQAVQVVAAS